MRARSPPQPCNSERSVSIDPAGLRPSHRGGPHSTNSVPRFRQVKPGPQVLSQSTPASLSRCATFTIGGGGVAVHEGGGLVPPSGSDNRAAAPLQMGRKKALSSRRALAFSGKRKGGANFYF